MWTRLLGGVLAVAGVVGTSSCATPAPAAAPPARTVTVGLPGDALDLATLSGRWGERQTRVEQAMRRVSDACLARHGFAPQGPVEPVEGFDEAAVVDLPRRERLGYGVDASPGAASDPASRAEARYLSTLTERRRSEYLSTLLGSGGPVLTVRLPGGRQVDTPRTGCVAEARAAVFGSVQAWATAQYVPEAIADASTHDVEASAAYGSALGRWRTCLRRSGLDARTPQELREASTVGSSSSVRAAVADGRCALEAHLPATALAVRRDLVARQLDPEGRRMLLEATRLWLDAADAGTSAPSPRPDGAATAMGSSPHRLAAR